MTSQMTVEVTLPQEPEWHEDTLNFELLDGLLYVKVDDLVRLLTASGYGLLARELRRAVHTITEQNITNP